MARQLRRLQVANDWVVLRYHSTTQTLRIAFRDIGGLNVYINGGIALQQVPHRKAFPPISFQPLLGHRQYAQSNEILLQTDLFQVWVDRHNVHVDFVWVGGPVREIRIARKGKLAIESSPLPYWLYPEMAEGEDERRFGVMSYSRGTTVAAL